MSHNNWEIVQEKHSYYIADQRYCILCEAYYMKDGLTLRHLHECKWDSVKSEMHILGLTAHIREKLKLNFLIHRKQSPALW